MKIKPAHYAHMKAEIGALSDEEKALCRPIEPNKEKLFRWNLCYRAGLTRYICDNVYSYADDTHIDTALRNIVKELSL